jgi:hypothetical protein
MNIVIGSRRVLVSVNDVIFNEYIVSGIQKKDNNSKVLFIIFISICMICITRINSSIQEA